MASHGVTRAGCRRHLPQAYLSQMVFLLAPLLVALMARALLR